MSDLERFPGSAGESEAFPVSPPMCHQVLPIFICERWLMYQGLLEQRYMNQSGTLSDFSSVGAPSSIMYLECNDN